MMEKKKTITVTKQFDGARLDTAAAELFGITRNAASALIEDGVLTICGVPAKKNCRVKENDVLEMLERELKKPDAEP